MILFLYLGGDYGIYALASGHILGLLIMTLGLIYATRRIGIKFTLTFSLHHHALSKLLRLASPLLIGALLAGANTVVDRIMASTLPVGSISSLGYADRIIKVIQSVLIMAIATASLPYLSEQFTKEHITEFKNTVSVIIRFLAFLFLPITIILLIFSNPLVELFFQRGAFSEQSTVLTSKALFFYSLGIFFMALVFFLSKVFHAIQETRINMYAAIISVTLNIVLNFVLIPYMGSAGIALATSLVYFSVSLYLGFVLIRKLGSFEVDKLVRAILRILVPTLLMSLPCILIMHYVSINLFTKLIISSSVALFSYLALSFVLKVPELRQVFRLVKFKLP